MGNRDDSSSPVPVRAHRSRFSSAHAPASPQITLGPAFALLFVSAWLLVIPRVWTLPAGPGWAFVAVGWLLGFIGLWMLGISIGNLLSKGGRHD